MFIIINNNNDNIYEPVDIALNYFLILNKV